MPELMNHVEFRTALENAIKGKSANKAPFSIAWATGKLSRDECVAARRDAMRQRRELPPETHERFQQDAEVRAAGRAAVAQQRAEAVETRDERYSRAGVSASTWA